MQVLKPQSQKSLQKVHVNQGSLPFLLKESSSSGHSYFPCLRTAP